MTGRNRHDPGEPMTVLCPVMQERISPRTGKPYRYGFAGGQKYLMFLNADGATWRLCTQPLSPDDRAAIPERPRPPNHAERNHAAALARLAEPSRYVSALPEKFLDGARREKGRR